MKEFENDLLSGNVEEKYLNMSREELEKNIWKWIFKDC